MFIKNIKLNNFRNYNQEAIDLGPNVTIFYGKNAQGKTNIIEAIYFFSMGKSHRSSKDSEIIKWETEESKIEIGFTKENYESKIEFLFKKNSKKQIKVNGIKIVKTSELLGNLNSVIFSPDHLKIIKEGPSERRRFIDIILSQTSKKYFYNLTQYNKVIEQRNKLLVSIKKQGINKNNLLVWDEQLIKYGSILITMRKEFIERINSLAKEIHQSITSGVELLKIEYYPSTENEAFEENMKSHQNLDIMRGITSKGPHRDEILFFINEKEVKIFGSQGQQRTTLLSLKLAELKYICEKTGSNPILLLDDVFSELDMMRQRFLIKYIENIQTIITCTDVGYFKSFYSPDFYIYKVENGRVEREKGLVDNSCFYI